MIKFMTNAYHQSHRGGMSEMSDEERMEYILATVEEGGMLPPRFILYTTGDYIDAGDLIDFCDLDGSFEWEDKEDE